MLCFNLSAPQGDNGSQMISDHVANRNAQPQHENQGNKADRIKMKASWHRALIQKLPTTFVDAQLTSFACAILLSRQDRSIFSIRESEIKTASRPPAWASCQYQVGPLLSPGLLPDPRKPSSTRRLRAWPSRRSSGLKDASCEAAKHGCEA